MPKQLQLFLYSVCLLPMAGCHKRLF